MAQAVARGLQLGAQGDRGLAHQQGGDQGRQHHDAEQHVGAGPGLVHVAEAGGAEPLGEEQCPGGGEQGGDPVAGHVARGEGGLALVIGDFQAVGVDGDVLGGGGEGHQHREGDQPGQVLLGIAETHADQADHHQQLREHQPGAAPAELAEQGQAPLVEQRRPGPT
ncbi:hypothetical protein L1887_60072 [Cichorium endivia]|nr:hypothetical protein L1887_60072 [Cichorium endivia]